MSKRRVSRQTTTLIREKTPWALLLAAVILGVLVIVGVVLYGMIQRLSPEVLTLIVGGLSVLGIVAVVMVLLIAKDVVQSYISRRLLKEDQLNDISLLKAIDGMGRGSARGNPEVNVTYPQGPYPPSYQPYHQLPGGGPQVPTYPQIQSWKEVEAEDVELE